MCLFQAHARSFRLKQPTSFDEQLSAVPGAGLRARPGCVSHRTSGLDGFGFGSDDGAVAVECLGELAVTLRTSENPTTRYSRSVNSPRAGVLPLD
jgi:hypothetical protein